MKVFTNEYLKIYYNRVKPTVIIKWLPENQSMSQVEISQALVTISQCIDAYPHRYMLFDFYEFNYWCCPELSSFFIQLQYKIDNGNIAVIMSNCFLGKLTLGKIFKTYPSLIVLNDRKDGALWLKRLV
jgi:phage gp36-like protein